MASTVIGLFDGSTQAEKARSEIMALQIPGLDIQVFDQAGFQLTGGTDTSTKGFWESLSQTLGFGPSNQAMYQEGVRRGGTVVSIRADDSQVDEIADRLDRCGAVDIEQRAAEWSASGWTTGKAPTGVSPTQAGLANLPADVGKREIKRGKVSLYRHVSDEQR